MTSGESFMTGTDIRDKSYSSELAEQERDRKARVSCALAAMRASLRAAPPEVKDVKA